VLAHRRTVGGHGYYSVPDEIFSMSAVVEIAGVRGR
jgi:hypothetical protein